MTTSLLEMSQKRRRVCFGLFLYLSASAAFAVKTVLLWRELCWKQVLIFWQSEYIINTDWIYFGDLEWAWLVNQIWGIYDLLGKQVSIYVYVSSCKPNILRKKFWNQIKKFQLCMAENVPFQSCWLIMQQNRQFVLNAAPISSSLASIITFPSSMEAVISDVKTVIRSRPLPLLAKGFFDDCRCWVFRPIWSCVSVWRDLLCGLMG